MDPRASRAREEFQKTRVEKNLDDLLLKYKGAIGVDVAHKEVRGRRTDRLGITVYVSKKLPKQELSDKEALPAEIEGIPIDVVECRNVWPSRDSSPQQLSEKQPRSKARAPTEVLVGGLSISNQYNMDIHGTLGIVFDVGGTNTAISCAHVVMGEGVCEPGGPQGGVWPDDSIGMATYLCSAHNNVDVGLVPITSRSSEIGRIQNIGIIDGYTEVIVGRKVKKMGAKTGLTEGTVSSTTLTWTYPSALGMVTSHNQIRVDGDTEFAAPGDSGSALIHESDSLDMKLMAGMVTSGSESFTVCNTITDLLKVIPKNVSFSAKEKKK